MTFFTETLALKEPPATADLNPPGVAMVTVLDRIAGLTASDDRFKAFLASLSTFLQPLFAGDSLDWDSPFGQGLIELEQEIRNAALIRSQARFGAPMSLDDLAKAMAGTQRRDANVKDVVGGLLSDVLTKLENDYLRWPGAQRTRATTLLVRMGQRWLDRHPSERLTRGWFRMRRNPLLVDVNTIR
nr:hypothetical protein [uncultured Rhodopila sp.]